MQEGSPIFRNRAPSAQRLRLPTGGEKARVARGLLREWESVHEPEGRHPSRRGGST